MREKERERKRKRKRKRMKCMANIFAILTKLRPTNNRLKKKNNNEKIK